MSEGEMISSWRRIKVRAEVRRAEASLIVREEDGVRGEMVVGRNDRRELW